MVPGKCPWPGLLRICLDLLLFPVANFQSSFHPASSEAGVFLDFLSWEVNRICFCFEGSEDISPHPGTRHRPYLCFFFHFLVINLWKTQSLTFVGSKRQKEEIPTDHLICASIFVVNNILYIKVKQKGLLTNMTKHFKSIKPLKWMYWIKKRRLQM